MRSLLPLAAAGGAGMLFASLPRWVKIPAVVGLVALGAIELTKDGNEAWNSAAIFGGQGEQGAAQMVDPKKTEADSAAGKEVSGAKRTVAAQWAGLNADALLKQAQAEAATESESDLLAKKAKHVKLSSTEELQLQAIIKARGEAEVVAAQATAARAEAKMNREAAELNSRLIESLQRNDGQILNTVWEILIPKGYLGKK
jgi:hypothetical protein